MGNFFGTMPEPLYHEPVAIILKATGNEQFAKDPTKIIRLSLSVVNSTMHPRDSWRLGGDFAKTSENDLSAHRFFAREEESNLEYEKRQLISDTICELFSRYVEELNLRKEYKLLSGISQQNSIAELRIREANQEIDELDDEMIVDGFPQVTDAMKDEARRIVRALAQQPPPPTVYGTQDGDIAIQFDSDKSMVVIELNLDGGAACFSYVGGKNRRARYDDSKDLPDEFVEAQLRRLIREL